MNFWKRMQLIGTVALAAIAIFGVTLALLQTGPSDQEQGNRTHSGAAPWNATTQQSSGTSGL